MAAILTFLPSSIEGLTKRGDHVCTNALIYYNEPAEVILDQRFDETGEVPVAEWTGLFAIADEERNPVAQEDRPMMMALSERKPVSRTVWMRCGHREWRHMNITAFPLIGQDGQFLGAKMIFWEV